MGGRGLERTGGRGVERTGGWGGGRETEREGGGAQRDRDSETERETGQIGSKGREGEGAERLMREIEGQRAGGVGEGGGGSERYSIFYKCNLFSLFLSRTLGHQLGEFRRVGKG